MWDTYDEGLRKRQKEHLEQVAQRQQNRNGVGQSCMHDNCSECVGTFIRKDGTPCTHMIACPCPKCSPTCMSTSNTGNFTTC
jgi:hypothetical protein